MKIRLTFLLKNIGLTQSVSEACRLVMQGAVKLNGEKITDLSKRVAIGDHVNIAVGKTKSFVGIA